MLPLWKDKTVSKGKSQCDPAQGWHDWVTKHCCIPVSLRVWQHFGICSQKHSCCQRGACLSLQLSPQRSPIQSGWAWAPGVVPQRPGCGHGLGRKGKSQAPEDVVKWQRSFPAEENSTHTMPGQKHVPSLCQHPPAASTTLVGKKGRERRDLERVWYAAACGNCCLQAAVQETPTSL